MLSILAFQDRRTALVVTSDGEVPNVAFSHPIFIDASSCSIYTGVNSATTLATDPAGAVAAEMDSLERAC